MKLTELSSEYLKFMVKTYSDTHKKVFQFEQFKELHPNLDIPFMSDAIYLLKKMVLFKFALTIMCLTGFILMLMP